MLGKWVPRDEKKNSRKTFEFARDGKLTLTLGLAGKATKQGGTYQLNGTKLTVALKLGDRQLRHELAVQRLGDNEIAIEDADGSRETWVRVPMDQ